MIRSLLNILLINVNIHSLYLSKKKKKLLISDILIHRFHPQVNGFISNKDRIHNLSSIHKSVLECLEHFTHYSVKLVN